MICGDYDADGMTSTALLMRALTILGAQVNYAIPSRMSEGYGINQRIVEECYAEGVSLILTVDNGIAACAPHRTGSRIGAGRDCHRPPRYSSPTTPGQRHFEPQVTVVRRIPFRGVAGVGVAYILAICLAQALDMTQDLTGPLTGTVYPGHHCRPGSPGGGEPSLGAAGVGVIAAISHSRHSGADSGRWAGRPE
jgi:single-stranded-DNA-specific exonuclease